MIMQPANQQSPQVVDSISASDNEWSVDYAESVVNVIRRDREIVTTTAAAPTVAQPGRICRRCETPFLTADARQFYCTDGCASEAARSGRAARQARHRLRHPDRDSCRQTLRNAVLLGIIRRPSRCEGCGELTAVDGHHSDYTRPWFVEWLCVDCHSGLEFGRHFGAGQSKQVIPQQPIDGMSARFSLVDHSESVTAPETK